MTRGPYPRDLNRLEKKALARLFSGEVVNADWYYNASGGTSTELSRIIAKIRRDLGEDVVTILKDKGSYNLTRTGHDRVESRYGIRA